MRFQTTGMTVPEIQGMELRAEGGGRQDVVAGVNVHVILLGVHGEIGEARGDRVDVVGDLNGVVDDAAGVGHPLPADHELVVGALAEGVAHAAVPAGKAHAGSHGFAAGP